MMDFHELIEGYHDRPLHKAGWDTRLAEPFVELENLEPIVERTGHWWLFKARSGDRDYRIHCKFTSFALRPYVRGRKPHAPHAFKILHGVYEPSPWVVLLRDLSIALWRACRSEARICDISSYLKGVESLRQTTVIIDRRFQPRITELQAAALDYLRGATGLAGVWRINLCAPFSIWSEDAAVRSPHGLGHIWHGSTLPPPLDTIAPTVRIHLCAYDKHLTGVSGPEIIVDRPVASFSAVDEMKALRDLSRMGLSDQEGEELAAFAHAVRSA